MEPEHLSCLSLQGALLLSRSGTGATLRLHYVTKGAETFLRLGGAVAATFTLGSRAEFEGRGRLNCGRSAPPKRCTRRVRFGYLDGCASAT